MLLRSYVKHNDQESRPGVIKVFGVGPTFFKLHFWGPEYILGCMKCLLVFLTFLTVDQCLLVYNKRLNSQNTVISVIADFLLQKVQKSTKK